MLRTAKIRRASLRSAAVPVAASTLALLLLAGCSALSGQGSTSTTRPNANVSSSHPQPTGSVRPNRNATALEIVSISPAPGAQDVGYASSVTVRFSEPLARNSAMPAIAPAPPGAWSFDGTSALVFRPRGNYVPFTSEKLSLPGGIHGLIGENGGILRKSLTAHFTVAGASELRLQQLLAELGYLPVRFVPGAHLTSDVIVPAVEGPQAPAKSTTTTQPKKTTTTTTTQPKPTTTTTTSPPVTTQPAPPSTVNSPKPGPTKVEEPSVASDIPLSALSGSFSWRFPNIPPSLAALWAAGKSNVVTTGAVMEFEAAHGLATDGIAGPAVWRDLLQAVAHRDLNTAPYTYVYVTTSLPETVHLWSDGKVIFETPANTGIPQSPTQLGTWPVYARYVTTTMSGTEPGGQHYSDPGIPWVSYFHGGDALHGYLRAQYGFPQSLGCVEMPYAAAGTVYPWTPLGTLVTVE